MKNKSHLKVTFKWSSVDQVLLPRGNLPDSQNGSSDAAKKQGCKIVVIDLDEHILQVRSFELSKYISRRKADFVSGMIAACYVVYGGEAVVVNASVQTRQEIMSAIEQLNPGAPTY